MVFIVLLVEGIVVYDVGVRWWKDTEWKRRLRRRDDWSRYASDG